MEGHWKFLGGGGVLKAKFLEAMYENKAEFSGGRGGGGVQKKKPSVRGKWIFPETVHYYRSKSQCTSSASFLEC